MAISFAWIVRGLARTVYTDGRPELEELSTWARDGGPASAAAV